MIVLREVEELSRQVVLIGHQPASTRPSVMAVCTRLPRTSRQSSASRWLTDELERQSQVAHLAHQTDRLDRFVVDLGLDHEDVYVAAWAGAATCMRTEQDHARLRCRAPETAACLKDLVINAHASNATASSRSPWALTPDAQAVVRYGAVEGRESAWTGPPGSSTGVAIARE